MKKIIICIALGFIINNLALAQSSSAVLDKIKEIKLLESHRDDVKRILANYESSDDEDYEQNFSNDDWDIDITYSRGSCFFEEDEEADKWNVPQWTVTKIEITPPDSIKIEDVGYNLGELKKEQRYANIEGFFVYHSKDLGVAFEAGEDGVQRILLFPPRRDSSRLCDNNEEAKKFYGAESWFGDLKLEDRVYSATGHLVPNVVDLILSATEIAADCNHSAQNKSCSGEAKEISVEAVANDPEDDVLTYNYTVTGGRIVGKGSKVVWDLTGVKPGTYTITAGVDDGCGVCGMTQTKEVVVRECSDCAVNSQETLPAKTEFRYEANGNEQFAKTNRETKKTKRNVRRKPQTSFRKSRNRRTALRAGEKRKINTGKNRAKTNTGN